MRRFDEALAEIKEALELDPLSPGINTYYGTELLWAGQIDQAIMQHHKTLELYPDHLPALNYLVDAYLQKGNHEDGIALSKKAVNLSRRRSPMALNRLHRAYAMAGKREEARKILNEVLERSKRGQFPPTLIAEIYLDLGDKDKTLQWLEKAVEERDPRLHAIKAVGQFYRSLHSDPRFTTLLKKMGLEE
jgi:serine/threonine-protein kinase